MRFKESLFIYSRYVLRSLSYLQDRLLPAACILCGCPTVKGSYNICHPCLQDLPILPQSCPQCAHFLHSHSGHPHRCATCLKNPPPFEAAYALFPYSSPIIQLIVQLKFQHKLSHAKAFGNLLAHKILSTYANKPQPDLLVPVPLHRQRLRERGFNQAIEIARPVSSLLRVPIDIHGITRARPTLAQSSLPAEDRKRNVENAFRCTRDYSGRFILLIDDVMTTGHTLMEISRLLKQQGAASIHVWCCARRG